MENKMPKRKEYRLEKFDYSSCGAYFITICSANKEPRFWHECWVSQTVARDISELLVNINHPQDVPLSEEGKIVDDAIKHIATTYPIVSVEEYVIMPDHIHLLLFIHSSVDGRAIVSPTVSRIVKQLKGYVTKRIGAPIWQKLFFDHVIRNYDDYENHVKYIYENPIKWIYKNR